MVLQVTHLLGYVLEDLIVVPVSLALGVSYIHVHEHLTDPVQETTQISVVFFVVCIGRIVTTPIQTTVVVPNGHHVL